MGSAIRALFAGVVAADPSRPMHTFYDDDTGERTELSGATMDNWVAKTANLLVDGCGLGEGDVAGVWLPPHWQTAAVLVGCWSAGLTVAYGAPSDAGIAVAFASLEAIEAGGSRISAAPDRYALGLAPLGAPLRSVVPGWLDYIAEVRIHGDSFAGAPVNPGSPARLEASGELIGSAEVAAQALARAAEFGIAPGSRVLVDGDAYPDPRDWLLPALAVGASTVLCVHVDPTKLVARAASEQVDLVLGPG
ncbi:MAG TPA: TIGR03089 family protein [Micromonosporaceae bacterium]|nr:TIGR03089 family protein [Micromonosporaceae bacterium]